jgi:hypothetical protein
MSLPLPGGARSFSPIVEKKKKKKKGPETLHFLIGPKASWEHVPSFRITNAQSAPRLPSRAKGNFFFHKNQNVNRTGNLQVIQPALYPFPNWISKLFHASDEGT